MFLLGERETIKYLTQFIDLCPKLVRATNSLKKLGIGKYFLFFILYTQYILSIYDIQAKCEAWTDNRNYCSLKETVKVPFF